MSTPVTLKSTQAGSSADYMKYLGDVPKRVERYQDTTLMDFTLIPSDSSFVKLNRGAYITLDSNTYPKWFTGYVTNDPELKYLGEKGKTPIYGYTYEASSDEYILSLKYIGIIPTFLNMTMGAIIKALAEYLLPQTFDYTNIQDGPLVAQYTVDPKKRFLEVVKDFQESASFVFYGNDHKLYFQPQDTAANVITLDAHDKNFTPSRLNFKPSTSSVFNDVTVIGDVEPQAYVTEYFVGTGLDSAFNLAASPFGADTSVLLQDDFTGGGISTQNWIVTDAGGYLRVANGYLNSLGGSGNSTYDINIGSAFPIPMEARLRITHGEWDFLGGQGIIGGMWTQAPNSSYNGLLYGLSIANYTLNPIVGGAFDNAQSVTVSTTKRYIIRTLAEFSKMYRTSQAFSYLDSNGALQTVTGASQGDTVTWSTIITEVDPTNGQITNQWNFRNTATLSGTGDAYATYYPLASNNLHATVSNITISVPINATLESASLAMFVNTNFDLWTATTYPDGWTNPVGVSQETTLADSGNALRLTIGTGSVPASLQQACAGIVNANTPYNIVVKLRSDTFHNGTVKIQLSGTGLSPVGLTLPCFGSNPINTTWKEFDGVLTTGLTTIPPDLVLSIIYQDGPDGSAIIVDNLAISGPFTAMLVGPNEIDAMDGLAPSATIISNNIGASTSSSYFGAPQYNAGQSQLVFFKDSITRTSDTPAQNQILRLSYRSAGIAVGRAVDNSSINREATNWGDNGHRTDIRTDLAPRPRNSAECEMAASALVQENAYPHYEGTYQQFSTYFATRPRAGYIVKFTNLDGLPTISEEINQVVTTLVSTHPVELFDHQITFGKPNHVAKFLARFGQPTGTYQPPNALTFVPAIDVKSSGTIFAADVTKPTVVAWDQNNIYVDAGQDLPAGSVFEVRYTDASWGVDDAKNLCQRSTTRKFTVVRGERGRLFFIKQVDKGNYLRWSEDLSQSVWTKSGASVSQITTKDPDAGVSQISAVAFSSGGYVQSTIQVDNTGSSSQVAFSASVKGPVGKTVNFVLSSGESLTVNLTGYWQRATVTGNAGNGNISIVCPQAATVQITRCSAESGSSERLYSRTTSNTYGPSSRFASMVNTSFPSSFFDGNSGEADITVFPTV